MYRVKQIALQLRRASGLGYRWQSTGSGANPKPATEASAKVPDKSTEDQLFGNPAEAFRSKTLFELIRAYTVYTLCGSSFLVDNNMALMKISKGILGETLFIMLMKMTFYGHFVAGENRETITPVVKRMQRFGVKSILDYSVEEDLSADEAEKREMESTVSEVKEVAHEEVLIGGEMPQYHASKKFADRRYKVRAARTYFYKDEKNCEDNLKVFKNCLRMTADLSDGSALTAIKLTALGRPQLLLQISEVIMRARRFVGDIVGHGSGNVLGQHLTQDELAKRLEMAGIKDTAAFLSKVVTDREGLIHLFPWSGIINSDLELNDTFRIPSLKEGRMVRLLSELSKKEETMFRNMIHRLNELAVLAQELDVGILIDAEQSYFQPAISRITMEMMNTFNKEKAFIYNTYQNYLRNTHTEIMMDLAQAKRQKFYFSCKLVRGAYLEQERARASDLKYEDPTNANFDETSKMYERSLTECMKYMKEHVPPGKGSVIVASHNEDSVRFALSKMKELNIDKSSGAVRFGQLFGMCDYLTFPLGQAGHMSYKYVPYGPTMDVLPYLSRRAQENRGILDKVRKEKKLIWREIKRRIFSGEAFRKGQKK